MLYARKLYLLGKIDSKLVTVPVLAALEEVRVSFVIVATGVLGNIASKFFNTGVSRSNIFGMSHSLNSRCLRTVQC